jgi:hypothetical protein
VHGLELGCFATLDFCCKCRHCSFSKLATYDCEYTALNLLV